MGHIHRDNIEHSHIVEATVLELIDTVEDLPPKIVHARDVQVASSVNDISYFYYYYYFHFIKPSIL